MDSISTNIEDREEKVENYYRFHSRIYDATRWSFLFGREALLDMIPALPAKPRILEVGCGTGKNIELLEYHFPDAQILGVDLSADMLKVAQHKLRDAQQVELLQAKYGSKDLDKEPFDLVLLSYSLTMIGDYETTLNQIAINLNSKGYVAVVDFHTSPFKWFRKWMGMNHANLDGSLLPMLKKYFRPVEMNINTTYGGLWSYFLFLGKQS